MIPTAHPTHNPNGISIGSAVFAQMTAVCPYTLQWDAPFPKNLHLPKGDLDSHLIHGSMSPPDPQLKVQTASRSVQPLLQRSLVWQMDRRTDHATRLVTIGRICIRSTGMRLNNRVHRFNPRPFRCHAAT